MNTRFCMSMLLFCGTVPVAGASRTPVPAKYQQGTIFSVQKNEVQSPAYSGGDNPSDTPLRSDYYAYQVAVQVNCGTYVGRYESPYDYLPSAFAQEHILPVRVTKDVLYFNLPGDQEMPINIVHRKEIKQACGKGNAQP
jgi:hypothetical protein